MSLWEGFPVIIGFIVRACNGQADLIGVGPALGATLATGIYKLLKVLDYASVGGDEDREQVHPVKKFEAHELHDLHPGDQVGSGKIGNERMDLKIGV